MTTTEPAVLPSWETETADRRHTPPIRWSEWAHDPGYVYTRLQEALRLSAEFATAMEAIGNPFAQEGELSLLRDSIARFRDEMRIYTAAGEEFLTVLEARCPEVSWRRREAGFVTEIHHSDVATRVARELRMGAPDVDRFGRSWHAQIEGWPVTVLDYSGVL